MSRTKKRQRNAAYMRSMAGRYTKARLNARARGWAFKVPYEDFVQIQASCCYYCGTHKLSETGHNMDRINSRRGYYIDNIRPCCQACNISKSNMHETVFFEHIERIYKHMKRKRSLKG